MFGRVMVVVGCLAALGLAGVGVQGYLGVELGGGLAGHVLGGMGAVLVLLLAHSWVLFYLLGAVRVLAGEGLGAPLGAFRSRVLPPLVAAVVAGVATFLLGIGVYAGRAPAVLHGGLTWVTLALQVWAAVVEWRVLVAVERAAAARRAV
ncbi:MAG TPA: hypothetical protein VM599_01765 [Thermoanaerobaculia bacterium]|nr:hypothetical protein [Thermoanaerobaculia bacterium]